MLTPRHKNAGSNNNVKASKTFQNVGKLKCFKETITDQSCFPVR
jgi:hypothetical protein